MVDDIGPQYPIAQPTFAFFGPNDLFPVAQCDRLSTTSITIKVPWFDTFQAKYVYVTLSSMELFNRNQLIGAAPFILVGLMSALVSLQGQMLNVYDASAPIPVSLNPGDNIIPLDKIARIDIDIQQKGSKVDSWYNSSVIAKYGAFQWGYPRNQGEMLFINQLSCSKGAPIGLATGALINLQKGTYGTATVYRSLQDTPPIQYSLDGGNSFVEFQGATFGPWSFQNLSNNGLVGQ